MASPTLEVVLRAKNEISEQMGQVRADADKMGAAFEKNRKVIGLAMAGMGAAVVGFGVLSIKQYTETGSALLEMSQRTGMSVEVLSELKYAAEQSGISLGTIDVAAKRMAVSLYDASSGGKEATEAFKALGVNLNELKVLKPEDQFLTIARRIADIPDPMERAALAVKVFGRSGADMLPMLAEGSKGMEAMRQRASELGVTFTEEGAKKAKAFGDAIVDIKAAFTGVTNTIASIVMPALKPLLDTVVNITMRVRQWTEANPELTRIIVIVAGVVGTLMLGLGSLLLILPTITAAVGAMGVAFTLATGPIGLTIAAIAAVVAGIFLLVNALKKGEEGTRLSTEEMTKLWQESRKEIIANAQQVSTELVAEENKRFEEFVTYAERRETLAQEEYDAGVARIKAEYGDFSTLIKSKKELAEEAHSSRLAELDTEEGEWRSFTDKMKEFHREWAESQQGKAQESTRVLSEEIDKQMNAEQDAFNERIRLINREYAEKLKLLDDDTRNRVEALQAQIEALNEQTRIENKLREEQRDKDRIILLQRQLDAETDFLKRRELAIQIANTLAEIERKGLLEMREAQKDKLREEIDGIRNSTEEKKDNLQTEFKDKKTAEEDKLQTALDKLAIERENLEKALAIRLTEIETERDKAIAAEEAILASKLQAIKTARTEEDDLFLHKLILIAGEEEEALSTLRRIFQFKLAQFRNELAAVRSHHADLLAEEAAYQAALAAIQASGGPAIIPPPPAGEPVTPEVPEPTIGQGYAFEEVYPFQRGGIVKKPIIAMLGEAGPEAVVPLGRGGFGEITIPVYLDSRLMGRYIVDVITRQVKLQGVLP